MPLGFYWDECPRCFGNPRQVMVFDKEYLHYLINSYNGKRPIFITHNSFKLSKFGFPEAMHVSKVFGGDMDNKKKPENALLDARKMCRFGINNHLPLAFSFSAGKGFHAYLLTEPEYYQISPALKDAIRAVQCWLRGLGNWNEEKQEYDNLLRTHDPQILGDERRLTRVWMTKYVSGKKIKGKFLKKETHCCPLTHDMVLKWSFDKIYKYSIHPEIIKFDFSDYEPLTLKQLIKYHDIKKPLSYMNTPMTVKDGSIVEFTDAADGFIKKLFPYRPCISEGICQENPNHHIRFAAVCYLRENLGWNEEQIINLFRSRGWIDFKNADSRYYVHHAYVKKYNPPSCEWLRKNGACIGFEKCEDLKESLIPGYQKFREEEWTSVLKMT